MTKCQPRALTPYLDGELASETRLQVEEHLRSCAACGALLDEVTAARERVRGMGRALIPATTLMPALAVFRERAGIGEARRIDLSDIPVPTPSAPESAATPEAAWEPPPPPDHAATDAAFLMAAAAPPDIEREPAAEEPYDAAPAAVEPAEPVLDAPAAEPLPDAAAPEAFEANTWVEVSAPPTPAREAAPTVPTAPAPPAEEAVATSAAEAPAPETPAPWTPPETVLADEPAGAPSGLDSADLPESWTAGEAALEERPDAPPPHEPPPWVEAEAADAEDMEAHGRRLVEEDLAAQRAAAEEAGLPAGELLAPVPEPPAHAVEEAIGPQHAERVEAATEATATEPVDAVTLEPATEPVDAVAPEPATGAEPADEVAEAVASMRSELEPEQAVLAATTDEEEEDEDTWMGDYRRALRSVKPAEPASTLGSLDPRVKMGVIGAAAVLLLAAAGLFLAPRVLKPRLANTTGSPAQASPAPHQSTAPSGGPTAAPSTVPSPASSAAPALPSLTGVVTTGSGGSGYQVTRLRSGSPGGGISRIVLDLSGGGPEPDAQLGRAADGSLYLQAPGISLDPALLQSFPGAGPVTAITPSGGAGASLKLAVSGTPQYSLYYLTGPSRLVIDLK